RRARRHGAEPSQDGSAGPGGRRVGGATRMKEKKPLMAMVSEYTALAFVLPVSTMVGYVIGYLLDKAFGTHFLYLVFLLIGIASGFVQLIRQISRDTRDDGS